MRNLEFLLVEDNPGDIILVKEALHNSKYNSNLSIHTKAEEARTLLKKNSEKSSGKLPDLILLDLNMQGMNGFDFLEFVKFNDEFSHIPVIIFTSSQSDVDIEKAYKLHANAYITKPIILNEFLRVIQEIEEFWTEISKTVSS